LAHPPPRERRWANPLPLNPPFHDLPDRALTLAVAPRGDRVAEERADEQGHGGRQSERSPRQQTLRDGHPIRGARNVAVLVGGDQPKPDAARNRLGDPRPEDEPDPEGRPDVPPRVPVDDPEESARHATTAELHRLAFAGADGLSAYEELDVLDGESVQ